MSAALTRPDWASLVWCDNEAIYVQRPGWDYAERYPLAEAGLSKALRAIRPRPMIGTWKAWPEILMSKIKPLAKPKRGKPEFTKEQLANARRIINGR